MMYRPADGIPDGCTHCGRSLVFCDAMRAVEHEGCCGECGGSTDHADRD